MLYQEEIIKTLIEAPKKMLNIELSLIKDKEYLVSVKLRQAVVSGIVEADVLANSKEDEWKEALSNVTKREAEKKRRLRENTEYQSLKDEINTKEREQIIKEKHLECDRRNWRSAVAMANLQSK